MSKPKIAIIISSTREKRFGEKAANWIHGLAQKRDDLDFEIVDLRDYNLPFFDAVASPLHVPVTNEVALRWGQKIAEFDGYLFVTAEYNRSVTGALKNAIDWLGKDVARKPAAYVGYGSVGAARAIEQLRLMCIELQIVPTRNGVHIGGADAFQLIFQGKSFEETPLPHLEMGAKTMFDELAWWAQTLKTARAAA